MFFSFFFSLAGSQGRSFSACIGEGRVHPWSHQLTAEHYWPFRPSISCSKVPRQCTEDVLAPPKLPAHFPSFVHKWGFNQEPSTSQPIQTELSPPPGKKKKKKFPTMWWLTAITTVMIIMLLWRLQNIWSRIFVLLYSFVIVLYWTVKWSTQWAPASTTELWF